MNLHVLKTSVRALRHRNYRLFYVGQGFSVIGIWMQRVAMGWLVYRLTNSPFLLGVVGFASLIPTFALTPITGVLADRWSRRYILLVMHVSAMTLAALLTIIVATGAIRVWHIIVLSLAEGFIRAFEVPARQSFVIEMVGRDDLGNAIALNSTLFNLARLIGPSVAGVVVAAYGEWPCFLLNSLSFLAVITALVLMSLEARTRAVSRKRVILELREGFSYVIGNAPIRSILVLLATVSLFGAPYGALMPVFARDILGGGPDTFGFLLACSGVGALFGAVHLTTRRNVPALARSIPASLVVFAVSVVVLGFSRNLMLSLACVFAAGFGQINLVASANTVIQTLVDEDKRGRVMSFYTMSFMGMFPFGNLLFGTLAGAIGAPYTVILGGALCLVGALMFAGRVPLLTDALRDHHDRPPSEVARG